MSITDWFHEDFFGHDRMNQSFQSHPSSFQDHQLSWWWSSWQWLNESVILETSSSFTVPLIGSRVLFLTLIEWVGQSSNFCFRCPWSPIDLVLLLCLTEWIGQMRRWGCDLISLWVISYLIIWMDSIISLEPINTYFLHPKKNVNIASQEVKQFPFQVRSNLYKIVLIFVL